MIVYEIQGLIINGWVALFQSVCAEETKSRIESFQDRCKVRVQYWEADLSEIKKVKFESIIRQ